MIEICDIIWCKCLLLTQHTLAFTNFWVGPNFSSTLTCQCWCWTSTDNPIFCARAFLQSIWVHERVTILINRLEIKYSYCKTAATARKYSLHTAHCTLHSATAYCIVYSVLCTLYTYRVHSMLTKRDFVLICRYFYVNYYVTYHYHHFSR